MQPATRGWRRIANLEGVESTQSLGWSTLDWMAGCGMIYCTLFGIGRIIFGQVGMGLALLMGAGLCVAFIFWDLNRRGFESLT